MLYIFYNSLAKSGSNKKRIEKIIQQAKSVFNQAQYQAINVIEVKKPDELINKMSEQDVVLLLGGDGTLTHITNAIYGYEIKPKIYAYRAGTGNDFLRDIKKIKTTEILDKRFYYIKPYINNLPIIEFNNDKRTFLNGVGFGIEANIARIVNDEKKLKGRSSFLRVTLSAIQNFKTYNNVKIEVDGVFHNFNNVWVISVMNGKYFGGGMQVAPNSNRKGDCLSLIIVHNISRSYLPLLFLSIYTGTHIQYKKYVKELFGKNIKIYHEGINLSQIDGESFDITSPIIIKK